MMHARVDGMNLAYDIRGADGGEVVLLIHPGHFIDWFEPLVQQQPVTARYRLVTYHRVGCGASSPIDHPASIRDHAAHARGLLRHLGIDRAHVVGHSSSGNVALQLALDAPEAVWSLAVLEPALVSAPSNLPPDRSWFDRAMRLRRDGDNAAALDAFLAGLCGPGYRAVLDRALPDAFAQHVADVDTFFDSELPAMQQWSFTANDARRIRQPVLAVVGEISLELAPIWRERHELLLSWLPDVESFVLPDASHLLQVQNPVGMAAALVDFLARHPMPPTPPA